LKPVEHEKGIRAKNNFYLLIEYIKKGRIKLDRTKISGTAIHHDPCNYGQRAQKRFGYGYFDEPC